MNTLPEGLKYLIVRIDCGVKISHGRMGFGQISHIYRRITRKADLDESEIKGLADTQ